MNFSPVPAREHVVIWEMRPDEARGALFEFGMDQRIAVRRSWRVTRDEPLPSFFKLKQFRKVPVVVSLHPALARTFILPFRLNRKKSEAPIQPADLQTMLRDFVSKTTFEMRRIAAEALGVEELDAILLDARLTRILADGAEARDDRPVEGRHIEGFLEVIFTARAVFHDLHDLLHSGREIFFTERAPAALAFLGRYLEHPIALLDLEAGGGWMFRFDQDAEEMVEKAAFRWDAGSASAALAEAFGISARAAQDLCALFSRGEVSSHIAHFMKKLFAPMEEAFNKALAKTKASGTIYVRTTVPLPFELPLLHNGAKVVAMPLSELLRQSGLSYDPREETALEHSLFLLPFLEYYYHRGDPRGHRALVRHIHWIAA